jgi:hypothetical protein
MLASTPHNRHRSARLDAQRGMRARQPLEMPGRYGFHSTRPAPRDAGGVASMQSRSSLKHRNQVFRACSLVVIEDDVAQRLGEWRAAKGT